MFKAPIIGALFISFATGVGYTQASETSAGNVNAGRTYAIVTCSRCHDVKSRVAPSGPTGGAPTFYAVANSKNVTVTGLHVFLANPHPSMPNLVIGPRDKQNVIAYILSLKNSKEPL